MAHQFHHLRPLWAELQQWLQLERRLVAAGGPKARAIDYTLVHWAALTRHLDDGAIAQQPPEAPNQAVGKGRRAWMVVGSELADRHAAIVMSLVQSARLNGHDPWAYLRDVLQRQPAQRSTKIEDLQIDDLLPHRRQPASDAAPRPCSRSP